MIFNSMGVTSFDILVAKDNYFPSVDTHTFKDSLVRFLTRHCCSITTCYAKIYDTILLIT
jgi:hypothetical protein